MATLTWTSRESTDNITDDQVSEAPASWLSAGDVLVTKEQRQVAEDVLLVLRYMTVVLALPLTLCNIAVFLHRDMRGATAVYVVSLSTCQVLFLVMVLLVNIFIRTFTDPLNDRHYWLFSIYAATYCVIVARRGSYVVMSLVSLERLYAVVRPLHVKSFFLHRHPFLSVTSAYVITAVMHTYLLAKVEVRQVREAGGRLVYRPVSTQLYLKHSDINDGFSVAAKVILSYCALAVLISLNVTTICMLRRHVTTPLQSTAKEEMRRVRERQMTTTILAATVSYVLLSLPSLLHNLVGTLAPQQYGLYGRYRNLYFVLNDVQLVLAVLSCAVDFLCFMTLSSSYRRVFFATLATVSGRRWDRAETAVKTEASLCVTSVTDG